jgi:hypothetical protein
MKNVLIALALVGMTYTSADAQNSANSKFAKNFSICLIGDQYQPCDPVVTKSDIGWTTTQETTEASLAIRSTEVHMGQSTGGNARFRSAIRVTYDDPNAPYLGEESMVNDGVQKNKIRNINTNNPGYDLPANTGGSLTR